MLVWKEFVRDQSVAFPAAFIRTFPDFDQTLSPTASCFSLYPGYPAFFL